MIVLKHLCREFDIEPYDTRMELRKAFGKAPAKRWQWDETIPEQAKHLEQVRDHLKQWVEKTR